jgi:hypothetical protein
VKVAFIAPGELTPVRSGALRGSIRKSLGVGEATVGSTVPYALCRVWHGASHDLSRLRELFGFLRRWKNGVCQVFFVSGY